MLSFCQAAVCLDFRQEWQQPEKQNRLKRCGVGKVLRKKIVKQSVPIRLAEQLHAVFRVLGKIYRNIEFSVMREAKTIEAGCIGAVRKQLPGNFFQSLTVLKTSAEVSNLRAVRK